MRVSAWIDNGPAVGILRYGKEEPGLETVEDWCPVVGVSVSHKVPQLPGFSAPPAFPNFTFDVRNIQPSGQSFVGPNRGNERRFRAKMRRLADPADWERLQPGAV